MRIATDCRLLASQLSATSHPVFFVAIPTDAVRVVTNVDHAPDSATRTDHCVQSRRMRPLDRCLSTDASRPTPHDRWPVAHLAAGIGISVVVSLAIAVRGTDKRHSPELLGPFAPKGSRCPARRPRAPACMHAPTFWRSPRVPARSEGAGGGPGCMKAVCLAQFRPCIRAESVPVALYLRYPSSGEFIHERRD